MNAKLSLKLIIGLIMITLMGISACVKKDLGGNLKSQAGWELMGPYHSEIACLAVDPRNPDTIYANTFGYLLRSTDGGRRWAHSDKRLQGPRGNTPSTHDLAVDPGDGKIVYAGTNQGIFKSIDEGESWTLISSVASGQKKSFVLQESTKGTRFFTAQGHPASLYLSEDKCITWQKVRGFNSHIRLLDNPSDPSTLMIGTGRELFITEDKGANWKEMTPSGASIIGEAVVSPAFPLVLYIWSQGGGLQRSEDGGQSWAEIPRFPGPGSLARGPWVTSIVALKGKPSSVFLGTTVGLFVGSENGRTLQFEDDPRLPNRFVKDIVVIESANRVYAATDNGVYVSRDLGHTWSVSFEGFPCQGIFKMSLIPSESGALFALGQGSLWKKNLGNVGWEKLSPKSHSFAMESRSPYTIYARTGGGKLAKSKDKGDSWETLENVKEVSKFWHGGGSLIACQNDGTGRKGLLIRSFDDGKTWQKFFMLPPAAALRGHHAVHVDPNDSSRISLGLTPIGFHSVVRERPTPKGRILVPLKVCRTLDGGKAWIDIPQKDELGSLDDESLWAAIITGSASPGKVLYAATFFGFSVMPASVVRSLDGGKTWEAFGDQRAMGKVLSLVVDPGDSKKAYAGCANGSVFMSKDAGKTWVSLGSPLPGARVNHIIIDLQGQNALYIATDRGIYRKFIP